MQESFGISRYVGWYQDGRQVYGCRGIGQKYKDFYAWLKPNIQLIWGDSDWPWHYFTMSPEDECKMYATWENDIDNHVDSEYYERNTAN